MKGLARRIADQERAANRAAASCAECGNRIRVTYVGELRLRVRQCPRCDAPLGGPATLPRMIHAETGKKIKNKDIKRFSPRPPPRRWYDDLDERWLMVAVAVGFCALWLAGLSSLAVIILGVLIYCLVAL